MPVAEDVMGISRDITYGGGKLHSGTALIVTMTEYVGLQCIPLLPAVPASAFVALEPLVTAIGYATGVPETSCQMSITDSLLTLNVGPMDGPTTCLD